MHMDLQRLMLSFFWRGTEENNKKRLELSIYFIGKDLKFQTSVCPDIFVTWL